MASSARFAASGVAALKPINAACWAKDARAALATTLSQSAAGRIAAKVRAAWASVTLLLRKSAKRMLSRRGAVVALMVPCLATMSLSTNADVVFEADYPEGIFVDDNSDIFFTEMARGTVRRISGREDDVFWSSETCGPTGITRIRGDRFAVSCHLTPSIAILSSDGILTERLTLASDGTPFQAPNGIATDHRGGAFFTDSGLFHPAANATGVVYRLTENMSIRPVLSGLKYPNGVTAEANSPVIYISEHLKSRIVRFDTMTGAQAVWFDFASHPATADLMVGFAGPDGLDITPAGGHVVALYGTGRLAYLSPCRELQLFDGFHRYVTSVGVAVDELLVASATTNFGPPFPGDVRLVDLNLAVDCRR